MRMVWERPFVEFTAKIEIFSLKIINECQIFFKFVVIKRCAAAKRRPQHSNIMYKNFKTHLQKELQEIKDAGLYKNERVIVTPQSSDIEVAGTKGEVLNFCANNYLGLADNSRLIEAAKKAMDRRGYGMSSVRFICGTQDLHKELEKAISDYFKTEDTILYAACFDANGGLFEPLFTEQDAIISDALNHASIIDGVRLCKAKRFRYNNADMEDL